MGHKYIIILNFQHVTPKKAKWTLPYLFYQYVWENTLGLFQKKPGGTALFFFHPTTHGIQFPLTPTAHVIRKFRTPTTHRIQFSYGPMV